MQIDLLPEIGQSPRILSEVDAALKAKQMKADVDEYLKVFGFLFFVINCSLTLQENIHGGTVFYLVWTVAFTPPLSLFCSTCLWDLSHIFYLLIHSSFNLDIFIFSSSSFPPALNLYSVLLNVIYFSVSLVFLSFVFWCIHRLGNLGRF